MSAFDPLTIRSDALSARILPYGASLVGLHRRGVALNLVLGFADPQGHARIPVFAGAVVGPVANRIRGGRLELAGQTHQMPQNDGGNTLHSGPEGLHARVWKVHRHVADRLQLGMKLADGDCGLPGNRVISADYDLKGDQLTLTLTAESDRPTAMNLAHHPYWTLDDLADIASHRLQIEADHFLPTDAQNLPTGNLEKVAGSTVDFRTARPVPRDMILDLNFCLPETARPHIRPVATLIGATGTRLGIATDAPGLQAYNGANLPPTPAVLPGHRALHPYHALALEPQFWPDAPHHPHFPRITMAPGHIWQQTIRYRITSAS